MLNSCIGICRISWRNLNLLSTCILVRCGRQKILKVRRTDETKYQEVSVAEYPWKYIPMLRFCDFPGQLSAYTIWHIRVVLENQLFFSAHINNQSCHARLTFTTGHFYLRRSLRYLFSPSLFEDLITATNSASVPVCHLTLAAFMVSGLKHLPPN